MAAQDALPSARRQLEEVIVVAEKKEINLQKIPMAVTALNARQIQDYRLWSVKDITALSPNLFFSNIGDERPYMTIRGVGANSSTMGVAMFVDDIPQTSMQNAFSVINDVDKIEILRGPQGTIYGRNAIGGVINLYTKMPANHINGYAEVSVGNYGTQRYSAGINGPIKKDKLFFKLSAFYNDRNGYITNDHDGQTFDHYTGYGVSGALQYKPSAAWDIYLNFNSYMNKNKGAYPYAANDSLAFSRPYTTNQNVNTWVHQSSVQPSLKISYTGSQLSFKSITSFQRGRFIATGLMDGDYTPYDLTTFQYLKLPDNNYRDNLSQEFRLSNNAQPDSKWKWMTGLLYVSEKSPTQYQYGIGKDARSFDPNAPYTLILNSRSDFNIGSAFAQASYQLTPHIEVTGGLRYDVEWKKFSNNQLFRKEGIPDQVMAKDSTRKATFESLSPKLNISWQAATGVKAYVAYSRGFRAGGFNEQTTNPAYINYDAEKSDNYELGVKTTTLDNKLRINVALFYIHWFDMQTLALIPGTGNQQVTLNTGKANNYGVEAEMTWLAAKGLQVNYNFGYNHARYKNLPLPDGAGMKEYKDNHVFLSPDYTSMLAVQYTKRVSEKKNAAQLMAMAEWQNIGTIYFDLKNTIRQSPYNLVNFKLGCAFSGFEVSAWIRNAFQQHYLSFGYSQNGSFVLLGNPRTFGLTTRVNF
ncbi:TonB-dependent receptor [Chitinophaga nivalis]|uniref:TonB-dependent receptor n=1 Tax=Chitinophaga nivalis TaxID=2991709 RepID=A0ABT3II85_9BACT|nr:TonB-dependent receptor [Chitinophaga nivalis]MCW3483680.1 TonB-dependent receptor [Chitinophaga nivalis]